MKKFASQILSVLLAASTALGVTATPRESAKAANFRPGRVPELLYDSQNTVDRAERYAKATGKRSSFGLKSLPVRANSTLPLARVQKAKQRVPGVMPNICGSVIESKSLAYGLYKLPTSASEQFSLIMPGVEANSGGIQVGDKYICSEIYYNFNTQYFMGSLCVYDLASGVKLESYKGNGSLWLVALAYDKKEDKIYCIYNDSYYYNNLGILEFGEQGPVITNIQKYEEMFNSIAFDGNGQLWGVTQIWNADDVVTGSNLVKLDKSSGALTVVGETGQAPQFFSDCTFDPATNRMFWTVGNQTVGGLYEIDTTTGSASSIYHFPGLEVVGGLYIPEPLAAATAPASVTNISADFPQGALSGTVNFTAPTTLYDGTTASGSLTYTVTANGETVANGTTAYGESVSASVTVAEKGEYIFKVNVSNETGMSPNNIVKTYIGKATPAAPKSVSASYSDGVMSISWLPVTTQVSDGYFDPAGVTYVVTRIENGANPCVIATTDECGCHDLFSDSGVATEYVYEVKAVFGENESAVAKSNTVTVGALSLPFSEKLLTKESFAKFIVINANGDANTWKYASATLGASITTTSPTMPADDWLITPALRVEAGKNYVLSFESRGYNASYAETLEVKGGYGEIVSDMTQTIMPSFDIKSNAHTKYEVEFTAETSGSYHVGFHALSAIKKKIIYLRNIELKEAPAGSTPAAVTGLTAVPDAQNALKVNVSMKAPAVGIDNNPLASLTKVEVKRGDAVVKTFDAPAPGDTLSFVDEVATSGKVYYTAIAYNEDGESAPATCSVFAGYDKPAAPTNIKAYETGNEGEVTVEWTPVFADVLGSSFDPSRVTFVVAELIKNQWYIRAENIPSSTTSFTYQAIQPGEEQATVNVGVFAVTPEGKNGGACSDSPFAGAPYTEFAESFANATAHYNCKVDYLGTNAGVGIGEEGAPFRSQDFDGGYLEMYGESYNANGAYISGKISLKGIANPGISLFAYYFDSANGVNTNIVTISVREPGGEWADVVNAPLNELAADQKGWFNINASLAEYAGKVVQVRIMSTVTSFMWTAFDNIKVGTIASKDLKGVLYVPASAKANSEYSAFVTVVNNGIAVSNPFSVDLYADGKKVATKECEPLAVNGVVDVEFPMTMNAVAVDPISYYAVVNHEGDEQAADNTTATMTVAPGHTPYPAPKSLSATSSEKGVDLSWVAPDMNVAPEEKTESFESAPTGDIIAKSFEGWTFVDGDNSPVGGIQDVTIPGMTIGVTKMSFFVWDNNLIVDGRNALMAHSGDKYLASFFRADDGAVDDWAISPALSGEAQTITFWAKSFSTNYPEVIEVYYSTGSKETADFVKVMDAATVPGTWTKYTVELPAGARHFAVRSCAEGSFMLMLDDFTFTPASVMEGVELLGYNVYCNGVKVNEAPVAETRYLHWAPAGEHSYAVTSVFSAGESAPSDVVTVDVATGLDAIAGGVRIRTMAGKVVVDGAEGRLIRVVTPAGQTLYSAVGEAHTEVALIPGVYVVKAGNVVAKTVVK